jgi:hypothetical protein
MYLLWPYPGPEDPDGFYSRWWIIEQLAHSTADWAQHHNVGIRTKCKKHGFVLTFDRETDYTMFALSWRPPPTDYPKWFRYEIKEPMRVDRHR